MNRVALGMLSGVLLGLSSLAMAQGAPLVRPSGIVEARSEASTLNVEERAQLANVRRMSPGKQAVVVSVEPDALMSNVITIALPENRVITARKVREDRRSPTDSTWSGKTDTNGEAIIVTSGKDIYGVIRESNRVFEIRRLAGVAGRHVLIEVDFSKLPPDHPADRPPPKERPISELQGESEKVQALAAGAAPNINILLAYTPQASAYFGGNIASAFQAAISGMNFSFLNSQVNLTVSLVGQVALPVEYPDSYSARDSVKNSLPVLIERDRLNADVVAVVALFNDACGVAEQIGATPQTAFASVSAQCLVINSSLAHEVGHLLGARHNIEVDPTSTPYIAGHGRAVAFTDSSGVIGVPSGHVCWHTIMAYPLPLSVACGSPRQDPRINYWSNPAVSYTAMWTAVPTGVAGSSNVASVITMTGPVVTTFRNTKLASPAIARLSTIILSMPLLFDSP